MERKIVPVVQIKSLNQSESDFSYWHKQTYEARLTALDEIRCEYNDWFDSQQEGEPNFPPGFKKVFIAPFNANHVRYLVVGGYAVALHGHPRYTKDLDIWVDNNPENARSILQALAQFGMGSLGLKEEDFVKSDQVVQIGYPPERIDILTTESGLDFGECFEKRVKITLDGEDVNFIDLENLKKNKKATGRLQDLADLENLE